MMLPRLENKLLTTFSRSFHVALALLMHRIRLADAQISAHVGTGTLVRSKATIVEIRCQPHHCR